MSYEIKPIYSPERNVIPYFKDDDFVLYKEDALSFLQHLPENSFDLIFADPPYFLSNGSFTCQNGKRVSVKKGDWDLPNTKYFNSEFH